MNHTERLHAVARQVRGLTRDLAREAVERYFASLAEEAAQGDWVTLPSLGRLQIVVRRNGGRLRPYMNQRQGPDRRPGSRLQACLRLHDEFKAQCRRQLPDDPH